MLKIYYGNASIDKEKFIYDSLKGCDESSEKISQALVIVPDQYTLGAEKQALKHLGKAGLMDVEIISMSRLGYRLLAELGGNKTTFIDKYGRHMLLSQIAREHKEDLKVYRGFEKKNSFIEMVNNFISEMKQYNASAEELAEMANSEETDSFFKKKLDDLVLLYGLYEKKIEGKYTDSEDYIDLFLNNIGESELIKDKNIWVYDFDSFAPKAVDVLGQLMKYADSVNVVLTYDKSKVAEGSGGLGSSDMFKLTDLVMENLEAKAYEMAVETSRIEIPAEYERISEISEVTVVTAANIYNEAESAASYVLKLVRDKGLRYRDIVVICNDQKTRSSVIKRVFAEYGIEMFLDKKRSILNSSVVTNIVSLLEVVIFKYRINDIFKWLKSGYSGISMEDIEKLENYGIQYKVRGTMWKKPFTKGVFQYKEEGLAEINQIRERAMSTLLEFEPIVKGKGTVKEFTERLYNFLESRQQLPAHIGEYIQAEINRDNMEAADTMRQIWSKIISVLDQIVAIIGEETFDPETFLDILKVGFEEIEVGLLPPTADGIIMGTMQRTRCADVKALLILGANEGLLPQEIADDGLFSDEEREYFNSKGRELCKVDSVKIMEESLAIYKNLAKPSDYLWVGYSLADEEGKEMRSSELIDVIDEKYPEAIHLQDVLNRHTQIDIIGGEINTLRHLTEEMGRGASNPAQILRAKDSEGAELWQAVYRWYDKNRHEQLEKVIRGAGFENRQEPVGQQLADELYKKEWDDSLSLSPSRLEKFSRCPFSHFVLYGLKPEERRMFEIAGREIGDVYHKCLMRLCEGLTDSQVSITAPESRWMTLSRGQCNSMVEEIAAEEMSAYRDGLFQQNNESKYKLDRVVEVCSNVAWTLIEQVRSGDVKASMFEAKFGRGKVIEPIEIKLGQRTIYIEGVIDRLDLLSNDRVKIIDYKTGLEKFDVKEAKAGYRLQLMTYLKAAEENKRKPAGVFYFLIKNNDENAAGVANADVADKVSSAIRKSFKMNGVMVDDPITIRSIAGDFEGYSDIVPLRLTKENEIKGTGKDSLLGEDEFSELETEVGNKLEEICGRLADGEIDIRPMKSKDQTPCTFCQYKGICRFDIGFKGCSFEIV